MRREIGPAKQRVEKKTVNDGSVSRSLGDTSLLSLSRSSLQISGLNEGEGRRRKETGKDDVFRKRHPRVSTAEGREERSVDGEGDPTDAIPEEAKAAWGFRPQPHARRSTMGEMLVPLTSNEFVSPTRLSPLIVRSSGSSWTALEPAPHLPSPPSLPFFDSSDKSATRPWNDELNSKEKSRRNCVILS